MIVLKCEEVRYVDLNPGDIFLVNKSMVHSEKELAYLSFTHAAIDGLAIKLNSEFEDLSDLDMQDKTTYKLIIQEQPD